MNPDDLHQFLADHDGVITVAQAFRCGLSRHQIHGRVKSAQWENYARGVYVSRQHHFGDTAMVRAVVAAHRRGVADRTTAAWWCGMLDELQRPLTVCVPRTSHRPPDLPVDVRPRHRSIPAEDLAVHRNLPVTGPALTVIGTIGTLEKDQSAFLDRMLQKKVVSVADLTAAIKRNRGMRGMGRTRELLATLEAGAESEAERLFVALLRLHEVTGWVQQHPFGGARLDFAWPAEHIAVEINGWAYHRDRDRFENDNAKAAMLASAGWLALSFTWRQLTEEPEDCIAQVAAALATRRA